MRADNNPFADLDRRGSEWRRFYNEAKACGDTRAMSEAGLQLTMIGREGRERAHALRSWKERTIARLNADNAMNRTVLEALEEGRIRTHMNNVDTTEADKTLYRDRIADLESVIEQVREYGL